MITFFSLRLLNDLLPKLILLYYHSGHAQWPRQQTSDLSSPQRRGNHGQSYSGDGACYREISPVCLALCCIMHVMMVAPHDPNIWIFMKYGTPLSLLLNKTESSPECVLLMVFIFYRFLSFLPVLVWCLFLLTKSR